MPERTSSCHWTARPDSRCLASWRRRGPDAAGLQPSRRTSASRNCDRPQRVGHGQRLCRPERRHYERPRPFAHWRLMWANQRPLSRIASMPATGHPLPFAVTREISGERPFAPARRVAVAVWMRGTGRARSQGAAGHSDRASCAADGAADTAALPFPRPGARLPSLPPLPRVAALGLRVRGTGCRAPLSAGLRSRG